MRVIQAVDDSPSMEVSLLNRLSLLSVNDVLTSASNYDSWVPKDQNLCISGPTNGSVHWKYQAAGINVGLMIFFQHSITGNRLQALIFHFTVGRGVCKQNITTKSTFILNMLYWEYIYFSQKPVIFKLTLKLTLTLKSSIWNKPICLKNSRNVMMI